ncbi:MAG TPA: carbohydrate binding domain-containing protein, partial [Polyangiaceae bacterium]|nr:carbohydrate binding domain-containing protein [Polyangiaceae bacterium]
LALGVACRVNPTSPDLEKSAEGKACPPDAKIDDAEDNNNQILVQDGRSGYVYTYVDSEGSTITPAGGAVFTMSPGGANGSQLAMRISGQLSTANIVYAALGMNFTDPRGPYDASKYKGISFFAKKGPGSTSHVRIKVPDKNTDPDGGICGACSNDFGMQLNLTEQWQRFIVPFSALRQESGWGNPRPRSVATDAIYALQFQVNDKGKSYDISIDDLAFTGCP